MTFTPQQLGAVIHLMALDYPPHETCRDLGISEVEFWKTLAEHDPCMAFETAYVIGRDNRILDENIPKEAGQRAYLKDWDKERGDLSELKMGIIEDALEEYGVKPIPEAPVTGTEAQ